MKMRRLAMGLVVTFLLTALGMWLAVSSALAASSRWGTIDMLAAREAIRDKIARYSLLHDGDGVVRDGRKWADDIWTRDASFQVIDQSGRRLFGNDEEGMVGREAIYKAFGGGVPAGVDFAMRHVLTNVAFDSLTANSAETRLVDFNIRGAKTLLTAPGASSTPQGPVDVYIMHDTWRRESDGEWRKARSVVYCVVSCPQIPQMPSK